MDNRHVKRCSITLIISEVQIKQDTTSHKSEWLSSKRTQITNIGRNWRKGNPHTLLLRMGIGAVSVENSMEVSQKIKNRTTL